MTYFYATKVKKYTVSVQYKFFLKVMVKNKFCGIMNLN